MFRSRLIGLAVFFCGCLISTLLVNAAITASWGDVIDIHYSLYTDAAYTEEVEGNINQTLHHIYLGRTLDTPEKILDLYPDASSSLLEPFKEAFIGMEVNQEKDFVIDATDHTYPGVLDGKDLYYVVILLEIVYDAPDETTTPITTASNGNAIRPPDLGFLLAAGAGVSLLAGGFLLRGYRVSQRMESTMSDKPLGTGKQDQVFKKEQSQLQELRELTETFTDPQDKHQKKEPVKFRRKR